MYPSVKSRYSEFVELLRESGPCEKDPAAFEMQIIQDPVRAKEIRDYFQLETLYDADADTFWAAPKKSSL